MKQLRITGLLKILIMVGVLFNSNAFSQTSNANRTFSGTVVNQQFELVPNVSIEVQTADGNLTTVTDSEGYFSLKVPSESLSVRFFGRSLNEVTRIFAVSDTLVGLQIKISYNTSASVLHVHVSHDDCVEVIVLRGTVREIRSLSDGLLSLKGVKHGRLFVTLSSEDMVGQNVKLKAHAHSHSHPH